MNPHEDEPRVDLVANPELLEQALDTSLADLTRYDNQVLLALVRVTNIISAAPKHAPAPEIAAIVAPPHPEGELVKRGLVSAIRRRFGHRRHMFTPESRADNLPVESEIPTWRIVLGEAVEKGRYGKAVPVAYIDPCEAKPYDDFMGNPAPGIGWPGFAVRYVQEYATGSPGNQGSIEFSPDPIVHGSTFGTVRLRHGAYTYLSEDSIEERKVFVDERVSKVRELVKAASNPNLNPGIAMEFARHLAADS